MRRRKRYQTRAAVAPLLPSVHSCSSFTQWSVSVRGRLTRLLTHVNHSPLFPFFKLCFPAHRPPFAKFLHLYGYLQLATRRVTMFCIIALYYRVYAIPHVFPLCALGAAGLAPRCQDQRPPGLGAAIGPAVFNWRVLHPVPPILVFGASGIKY